MPYLISLINLGCTKNLVDSQLLLGKLLTSPKKDILYSTDPYDPEVELVFLNTCGFISSGREEMFQTIDKLLHHQKKICLLGCAVQYYEKLGAITPQRKNIVNNNQISFLSRNDLKNASIPDLLNGFKSQTFQDFERLDTPRALTNLDQKFEYLKIAEGCNNSCSFCIIPQIRGKQISLPIPTLLQEIRNLITQGIEEIILIAQDSTRYGIDLYGSPQLFQLLEQIEQLPWKFRYRVLYLYPDILTLQQLKKLTSFPKFIPYFDIPLQHISSTVLQRMGRFYDEQAIYHFLDFIKAEFPVHFIRTNVIIGFPGETEADFQLLYNFIAKDYFDNIALFEYHDEPLAASFQLPEKIPAKVIRSRFRILRSLVNQLFLARQQAEQGSSDWWYVQKVYQDKKQTILSIRPRLHCPEIDEVDDISVEQLLACDDKKVDIGSRVEYVRKGLVI